MTAFTTARFLTHRPTQNLSPAFTTIRCSHPPQLGVQEIVRRHGTPQSSVAGSLQQVLANDNDAASLPYHPGVSRTMESNRARAETPLAPALREGHCNFPRGVRAPCRHCLPPPLPRHSSAPSGEEFRGEESSAIASPLHFGGTFLPGLNTEALHLEPWVKHKERTAVLNTKQCAFGVPTSRKVKF